MNIGDTVFWDSQSQGFSKRKKGIIIAIIPAGIAPLNTEYADLLPDGAGSLPRKETSYIVAVPGKTERAKAKHYWPRTSALILQQPTAG